jgi:lipid-A-disaccharide synthase
MMNRVMIIAGESSGDAHGAGVVRELKKRAPALEIFGIGGDKMEREGMTLTFHVRQMSFMGFIEVLRHLPLIRKVERTLELLLKTNRPDAVLLIDYPGFNLRFARIAKKYGIKVFYYISPQVWAWKKSRLKKMPGLIDKMMVILPFEEQLYREHGIPVEFVGHPLLEEMDVTESREEFCARIGVDPGRRIVALIPGSRHQEINSMFPPMFRAAEMLRKKYPIEIVAAAAPNIPVTLYRDMANVIWQGDEGRRVAHADMPLKIAENSTHALMKFAWCAVVTSGTATLETGCFATPMVVVYKTSWITYWLARLVVHIKTIALVNIVAGKTVVPELIQHQANADAIARAVERYLTDDTHVASVRSELSRVMHTLGEAGASKKVADAILNQ